MFTSNKKQYINILQQNKQLRVDFKTVQENKIIKKDEEFFLKNDDFIPTNAETKINLLQKKIKQTFISSLYESPNQVIVPSKEVDSDVFESIALDNTKSIIVPKNEISLATKYYAQTGIDYLLSPFTIIQKYLEDNAKNNSLNFLIYNNIIYMIILNNKKELSYNTIKSLTPFELTQDETFFQDDIVGQKLYEEVSFLEIQEFINETIEDYYNKNSDMDFLEHIEILYTLRPMSDEQVSSLEESLMIPVTYESISIDSYMDEIIQKSNAAEYSFIAPRKKEEDKSFILWIALSIITLLIVVFIFIMQFETKETLLKEEEPAPQTLTDTKETEAKILPAQEKKQTSVVLLPKHIQNNKQIIENIQMLFDIVPYDAILKDIEINEKSSTFVANFIKNSSSLVDMQMKLKVFYKESKVLLENNNKLMSNIIIQNTDPLVPSKPVEAKEYKKFHLLSSAKATQYLKEIALENSIITYDGKKKEDHLSYFFTLTSSIKTPDAFFDFIDALNAQNLSIEVAYPIVFSSKTDEIEVNYKIKMHQQNTESPSLKK